MESPAQRKGRSLLTTPTTCQGKERTHPQEGVGKGSPHGPGAAADQVWNTQLEAAAAAATVFSHACPAGLSEALRKSSPRVVRGARHDPRNN